MDTTRLRPHRHLLWRGIGAILAFCIPTFGALIFVTAPDGPWMVVLTSEVILLLVLCIAVYRYLRTGIWVDAAGIAERGFFLSRGRVPLAQIGSLVSANVFRAGGADTVPQLFICDHDGQQLVRLRGQFWSEESMRAIMTILEAPVVEIAHPVSTMELHRDYPGLLYWFERRPILAYLLFAGLLALGGVGLYALLVLLGATS